MDANQSILKNISKIALAAMGLLFVLGMIFYKERVLFCDAAFRIFHLINNSRFDLPGNRYGAFVVQVLPYIARKLHLSVNTILFLYGSSYNLFYFLTVALLIYRFRQYSLAILMSLYYFLFISESFIWVSETFHGTAWMFLFFALTQYMGNKEKNRFTSFVLFLLCAFLAIFSHFVLIIPITFLWVYFIIEKKNWPFTRTISILLSCVLIIIIALKFADTDLAYDAKQLHHATHFSLKDIINTFQTPVVQIFLYRCITNYWLGTLIFIISIGALIKSKEILLAIWTFVSVLGYIIIMGLTYGQPDSASLLFHIESEWSCISILVTTPFVFTFLPMLRPQIAACLISGIFIIRFVYIIISLSPFSMRIDMEEQILGQMRKKDITKLALAGDDNRLKPLTQVYWWALPYESILKSSIDGDKQKLTFLLFNPDDKYFPEELKDPKGFYDIWNMVSCSILNQEYFNIDSMKPYQVMSYTELMK